MPTLLPKKTEDKNPFATDDEAHEGMVADPAIDHSVLSCPVTVTTNATTSTNTTSFGQSASGFGSAGPSFGTTPSTSGFGGSGFGGSSPTGGLGQMPASGQQDQSKLIQSSGGAMQEGAEASIKADDKFGNFINSKWRPMMAVIYMLTCTCDFVIFPILWSLLQALSHGSVTSQWQPLTLQGAGLYHIAMGAVLGLAAYGRSQEKIAGKS
jgi:hypothetical protein